MAEGEDAVRAILIYDLTRLEIEVAKEGTPDSVKRNYEEGIFDSDLLIPDKMYKSELARVRKCILGQGVSVVECLRHEAQGFVFRDDDMVVILGDDGCFVNIAKLLKDQKVITIATSTKRCDRLMKFTVEAFEKFAVNVFNGKANCIQVSIARAETSLGHSLEAINDFFVGRADLRSSRYAILQEGFADQVSSGVILSTGTGSTGWEKSARGKDENYVERELDDEYLTVVTRELCYGEDFGVIDGVDEIIFRSNDNDTRVVADGVLFDSSMLRLPAGATVTITSNVRVVNLFI